MAFDLRPAQIEARFSVFVVCDSEEEEEEVEERIQYSVNINLSALVAVLVGPPPPPARPGSCIQFKTWHLYNSHRK